MTIEVRQLTIRSTVGEPVEPAGERSLSDSSAPLDEGRVRHLLQDVLAECKRLIDRRLADERER